MRTMEPAVAPTPSLQQGVFVSALAPYQTSVEINVSQNPQTVDLTNFAVSETRLVFLPLRVTISARIIVIARFGREKLLIEFYFIDV